MSRCAIFLLEHDMKNGMCTEMYCGIYDIFNSNPLSSRMYKTMLSHVRFIFFFNFEKLIILSERFLTNIAIILKSIQTSYQQLKPFRVAFFKGPQLSYGILVILGLIFAKQYCRTKVYQKKKLKIVTIYFLLNKHVFKLHVIFFKLKKSQTCFSF